MTHSDVVLVKAPDRASLAGLTAARFTADMAKAQEAGGLHGDGIVRVVLTGGGSGGKLLERIALFELGARAATKNIDTVRIDFNRVYFYFGDERNVAQKDTESNEGLAIRNLLAKVGVPKANVFSWGLPVTGKAALEATAKQYEKMIEETAPKGFDLHLLGMGGEGHINSLFPHTEATAEDKALTAAVTDSPKPPAERLTLTFPAIARAERVWFIVAGRDKADAVKKVVDGADRHEWPGGGARGRKETLIFLDEPAAALLD